jgi:hypothetical protein
MKKYQIRLTNNQVMTVKGEIIDISDEGDIVVTSGTAKVFLAAPGQWVCATEIVDENIPISSDF